MLRVRAQLRSVLAPRLGGLLPWLRRRIGSGFGRAREEPAGEATQPFRQARRCRGSHGVEV